jgi:hypothetical protein
MLCHVLCGKSLISGGRAGHAALNVLVMFQASCIGVGSSMAEEPDNLVPVQLREIRAILVDQTARFDRLEGRFGNLESGFSDLRLFVSHALGLGTTAELKTRELDARQNHSDASQKRTDERLANIERRVAKIEEKLVD